MCVWVYYLGSLIDANCILQADVLRADELAVSLQRPQLEHTRGWQQLKETWKYV